MRKKFTYISLFFVTLMLFAPIRTEALTNQRDNFISNGIFILDDEEDLSNVQDWMDEEDDTRSECSGKNTLLGDPNDEDSVAWLLQKALNYIKVIGPILVIVLSSIDYLFVIIKSDDESMKKVNKKLIVRLILAVCLFFIPVIVEALLGIFGLTTDPTCGLH